MKIIATGQLQKHECFRLVSCMKDNSFTVPPAMYNLSGQSVEISQFEDDVNNGPLLDG